MKVCITGASNLTEILLSLAAARELRRQGHSVSVAADTALHDIFGAVSYCKPVSICASHAICERTFEIGTRRPEVADAYKNSGTGFGEFFYDKYEELRGKFAPPEFDRMGLACTEDYMLSDDGTRYAFIAPTGYYFFLGKEEEILKQCAQNEARKAKVYTISDTVRRGYIFPRRLRELPDLCSFPLTFVATSGPAAIVRAGLGLPLTIVESSVRVKPIFPFDRYAEIRWA